MSWEPTGQFVDHNPVVEKDGKYMIEFQDKRGDRYKLPLEKELQDAMFPPSAPASAAGAEPIASCQFALALPVSTGVPIITSRYKPKVIVLNHLSMSFRLTSPSILMVICIGNPTPIQ